jgi:hypothetical protein
LGYFKASSLIAEQISKKPSPKFSLRCAVTKTKFSFFQLNFKGCVSKYFLNFFDDLYHYQFVLKSNVKHQLLYFPVTEIEDFLIPSDNKFF